MEDISKNVIETEKEIPLKLEPKIYNRKHFLPILTAVLIIIVILISFIGFHKSSENVSKVNQEQKQITNQKIAPQPFPFQEITIPYLRKKVFDGRLGELQQVSKNANYTAYLTSYTSEGLKINGELTVPQGEKPEGGWPAIVFVHGYIPPKTYTSLGSYVAYVDYLARNGFVVFKIDLRGHGDSEGEAGGGYYSSDYIIDTLNAKAALESSEYVAPGRVGLWGHSMAGNVVARALAIEPNIKAVVIWAGAGYTYTDLSEYRIQDNSYQAPSDDSPSRKKRNEMIKMYGDFDPKSTFWKQVPMTNYLGDIKGAIQLNHAVNDEVVNIEYSRNLNKILDNTTIVHELHEYPSGGHNISDSSFTPAMQNTVTFFKSHL